MLVKCPNCQAKSRITSSTEMSLTVRNLYCQCSDVKNCGATFVMSLAFKNYLNPPINNTQQLAANLINHLPEKQRKELLQGDFFGN